MLNSLILEISLWLCEIMFFFPPSKKCKQIFKKKETVSVMFSNGLGKYKLMDNGKERENETAEQCDRMFVDQSMLRL